MEGTHPEGPSTNQRFAPEKADADPCHATVPLPQVAGEVWRSVGTGFLRFPFNNFRYSLTLFSKFFASFPHGTCALSVSHQYLALDGIYHPLWAAIPSNSTLRYCVVMLTKCKHEREFHPFYCPIPKDSECTCSWQQISRSQFGVLHVNADTQIDMVRSSLFTRRYLGNHYYFIFLHLIICLNSVGSFT